MELSRICLKNSSNFWKLWKILPKTVIFFLQDTQNFTFVHQKSENFKNFSQKFVKKILEILGNLPFIFLQDTTKYSRFFFSLFQIKNQKIEHTISPSKPPIYEHLDADIAPSGSCARRKPNSNSDAFLPAAIR